MADNTTILGKSVIIGGSEHIRDSDYEEAIVEGVIYVGDLLAKGTSEKQVIAATETGINFKGIAIEQMIRASDVATHSTVLTEGKRVKYLKPTGGKVKVRCMAMGFSTGGTVPSGEPVRFNGTGTTIAANDSQLGDAYVDPACTDDAAIIGRLAKPVTVASVATNSENAEMEMWY